MTMFDDPLGNRIKPVLQNLLFKSYRYSDDHGKCETLFEILNRSNPLSMTGA